MTTHNMTPAIATALHRLRTWSLFDTLSRQDALWLATRLRTQTVPTGHHFFEPDTVDDSLFFTIKGRVRLYRCSSDNRKLTLAILADGATFGENILYNRQRHATYAESLTHVTVGRLYHDDILHLMTNNPQFSRRMLSMLGERIQYTERLLEERMAKSLPSRLAGLLLHLYRIHGDDGQLRGYTHQSLAEMLGTYRETITQSLNDFQRQEVIGLKRRLIEIFDEDALSQIAAM